MNSSGPISLGGASAGQSINLEVGQPATSTVSLNDIIVRQLAGVVSGQIVIPTDFYGKSLANTWFAQYTDNDATRVYNTSVVCEVTDSEANMYFFSRWQNPPTNLFYQNITKISGEDGSILWNNQYQTTTPSTNSLIGVRGIQNSNYYPTKILTAFSKYNGGPPTSNYGTYVGYMNKSDGVITSYSPTTWAAFAPNQTTTQTAWFGRAAMMDFPNGNILFSYSSPNPFGQQAQSLILDSSFNLLATNSLSVGSVANRCMNNTELYSGNTLDFTQFTQLQTNIDNNPGCRFTIGQFNGSSLTFANIKRTVTNTSNIGINVMATSSNYRYYSSSGANPSTLSPTTPRTVWRMDRSNQNIDISRTLPATGQFETIGSFSKNVSSTGNLFIATTSGGINYLRQFDANLNNTATWTITGSAGVSITSNTFGLQTYRNGFLYLQIGFTNTGARKYWVLKIKEDLSTLASGLTATVNGFTITLTPNNAQNITSYDAPFTTTFNSQTGATPAGAYPTASIANTPSPSPSFVTATVTTI
jgi:hypothetical protein